MTDPRRPPSPSLSLYACVLTPSHPPTLSLLVCHVDVLSNRKLLAMLLSRKGIQNISFANDGVQAVNTVVASRTSSSDSPLQSCFDLIFMDNTMPLMVRPPPFALRLCVPPLSSSRSLC